MKAFFIFCVLTILLSACAGKPMSLPATPTTEPSPTPVPYRQPEVTVWAQFASYQEMTVLRKHPDLIKEVNFVWYQLGGGKQVRGSNPDPYAVKELQSFGIRVVPAIQNSGFNADYVHDVIGEPESRAAHVASLLEIVLKENYDGLDIDYESLYAADRENFSLFIEELYKAFKAEGKVLSVTVHPKTSEEGTWEGPRAQDWARLGAACDMFKIMVYDYNSGNDSDGPVAPVFWAEEVINYAAKLVPPEKTYLGLPFYGYDRGPGSATSLTWMAAQALIKRNEVQVLRDESNEAYFSYGTGSPRNVYFNDALATETKVKAIWDKHPNLAGVSIWVLGGEDPENWTVLRKLFIK